MPELSSDNNANNLIYVAFWYIYKWKKTMGYNSHRSLIQGTRNNNKFS